ncbi:hypothetical protein GCM10010965_32160 [Caldalkalibacillus thermarum]|uniref:hypothetical protein n=1 Tax=Caldalkalibacillus thermarum TaxID=296745 RepID=UPI00166A2F58|nr:hypothetical protein [Caldalkalibacillus thermarum]GGK36808.1 hypothetical protein GCM10010965_32160 [Caldalkalibacillus thermarum]
MEALRELAYRYFRQANNPEEADRVYQRVLELDPHHTMALHQRALVLIELEEWEEPERLWHMLMVTWNILEAG